MDWWMVEPMKKYTINGVEVSYEDFAEFKDVPQKYVEEYRYYRRVGSGNTMTPRELMEADIRIEKAQRKWEQTTKDAERKAKEAKERERLDFQASLNVSTNPGLPAWEAGRAKAQAGEDKGSVILFVAVFVVACLLLAVLAPALAR